MKKLVLFTLCLLALFCALRAAGACKPAEQTPEMRTLIFTTWPTGAKVFVHDEEKGLREIGVSGKPIELDLNTLPEKGDFTVLFKLDGFGDREEKIPVVFFRKNARYPSTGTLRLKALSPLTDFVYLVKENLIPVVGGLIILLCALAYVIYLGQRKKASFAAVEYSPCAPPAEADSIPELKPEVVGPQPGGMRDPFAPRASGTSRTPTAPAPAKSDDPRVGRSYGNWRLAEKLSAAGVYTVYRGVPKGGDDSQSVIVKVAGPDTGDDDTFVQRFKREITITSGLNHPNLIKVLGWGEDKGETYYVTEMVRGKSLRTKIVPKGLPVKEFVHIFRQICDGLAYAHDNGIVHRDMKPEHLVITEHGRVLISDFTIAKGFAHVEITTNAVAFGTPGYMAPEQLQGAPLDPRSDQYSLGVVAYELLAGCRPFPEVNLMASIMQQLNEEPPPLSSYRNDVPPEVESMVMRMLSKKPVERFYDLREVLKYIKKEITDKREEEGL